MNKVVLIGRLTKDPELRYTPGNGVAVCRFTLAINRLFKKDETDFINCIAFNKQGEAIAQYVTKGRQLAVIGNIRTGSYDGQDGIKRYTTDILVESFEFIGNSNNGNVNTNNQNIDYWSMSTDNGFGVEEPIDDGDMPF